MATQTTTALSIARPLAEALQQTPFEGRVMGRFQQACNLVDSAGRVIVLTLPEVGNGPFSMVVEGEPGLFDSLRVGQAVAADEQKLVIGDWLVDLKGAAFWEPELPRLRNLLPLTPALAAVLKPYQEWPVLVEDGLISQHINMLARQAARQLHEAIFQAESSQTERLEVAVSQLAGLGSGLTPAGDDYLVGVMAALWLWGLGEFPAQIAAIARPKTTTLSAAFLLAAGQGCFIESWHGLVQAMDSGSVEIIGRALERIAHFGASSGLDALAGFSTTFLSLVK